MPEKNPYWKDFFNSNAAKFPDSLFKQVAQTVGGRDLEVDQFDMLFDAVRSNLDLNSEDSVADLCCGNGLLTVRAATLCTKVVGVDFSEALIANARKAHAGANIEYLVSDVAALPPSFYAPITKAFMCYALQHLTVEQLDQVLTALTSAAHFKAFFISGIPEKDRLAAFYDTPEKLAFHAEREAAGAPHIGKWWSHPELEALAAKHNLALRVMPQAPNLFSQHYRFDCLFTKAIS